MAAMLRGVARMGTDGIPKLDARRPPRLPKEKGVMFVGPVGQLFINPFKTSL